MTFIETIDKIDEKITLYKLNGININKKENNRPTFFDNSSDFWIKA